MDNKVKKGFKVISKDGNKANVEIIYDNDSSEVVEYYILQTKDLNELTNLREQFFISNIYIDGFSYADFCRGNKKEIINLNANDIIFDGYSDFSGAVFEGSVSFSNAMFGNGDVNFEYTSFKYGDVIFDGVVFGERTTSFKNASFGEGSVSFRGATFGKGGVTFRGVSFGEGSVSFEGATFGEGGVSFESADFGKGNVSFGEIRLNKGNLYFDDAIFGEGDVSFSYAKFNYGDVLFRNTVLGEGNISFRGAELRDAGLLFINTSFASSIDRKITFSGLNTYDDSSSRLFFSDCVILVSIVLHVERVTALSFQHCTNSGVIDLRTMGYEEIRSLRFINFLNLGVVDMNWDSLKKSIEDPNAQDSESSLADEMKMLKENFHNQGYYDWEDEAYVKYMNYHRNTLSPSKKRALCVLERIGDYGTNPLKVFLWMFAVVFVFGLLYLLMGSRSITVNGAYKWWSPFYYSMITFLTVGYGDFAAQTGLAALLAGIEGFLGVFLMSYFSVSLVRKTLR